MTWNPLVKSANRFASSKMTEGRPVPKPTHVVCHITGTSSFAKAKKTFLNEVSPHYLVDQDGVIYQFVEEENQAWHSGIKAGVQTLYDATPSHWRRYLYCFDWYAYPAGSVFLDAHLHPVDGKDGADFVRRPDSSDWPDYDYFNARWGAAAGPLNYQTSKRPNAYSVGIEILSVGSKTPSDSKYSTAMYKSLRRLVTDICDRNGIPMQKGRVVGHEDVNPMQRWGWDPNQGFDWSKVWG